MTNRYVNAANTNGERIVAPKEKAERERFWIDRGNCVLLSEGRSDLEWICVNGHYSIVPRQTFRRREAA